MLRLLRLFLLAAAISLLTAGSALGAGLQFSAPVQLPNGNPDAHPFYTGGEPSIAFDPNGDGHLYVTAPEFIPAALNSTFGLTDGGQGVAYWASDNGGASWPRVGLTGTQNGGGGPPGGGPPGPPPPSARLRGARALRPSRRPRGCGRRDLHLQGLRQDVPQLQRWRHQQPAGPGERPRVAD